MQRWFFSAGDTHRARFWEQRSHVQLLARVLRFVGPLQAPSVPSRFPSHMGWSVSRAICERAAMDASNGTRWPDRTWPVVRSLFACTLWRSFSVHILPHAAGLLPAGRIIVPGCGYRRPPAEQSPWRPCPCSASYLPTSTGAVDQAEPPWVRIASDACTCVRGRYSPA
jgi:hypothetical protein